MPLFERHQSPLWGIWKIDETWEELLQLSERPNEYLPILERFISDSRKKEWLAIRILLKELLNEEATIAYHKTGVPYLPNHLYNVSISHTKGYAAIILGKNRPVGIDLEFHSERVHRIKSRFMNSTELALLGDLTTELLLVCWSAKESTFKAMQQRVVDLQTDLHIISFSRSGSEGTLAVKETFTPKQAVYQVKYHITPDFVLTHIK